MEFHFAKHAVEEFSAVNFGGENDHLVERDLVKKVEQGFVLELLGKFRIVLLEAVKGQAFLVVDVNDVVWLVREPPS